MARPMINLQRKADELIALSNSLEQATSAGREHEATVLVRGIILLVFDAVDTVGEIDPPAADAMMLEFLESCRTGWKTPRRGPKASTKKKLPNKNKERNPSDAE